MEKVLKWSVLAVVYILALLIIFVAAISALAIFGFAVAVIAALLAYFSPGFRHWLTTRPGYRKRLSRLPGLANPSPTVLAISILLYLIPLSIVGWFLLPISDISTAVFSGVFGLIGFGSFYGWFIHGWRLERDESLAADAPRLTAEESIAFLKEHRFVAIALAVALALPLVCTSSSIAILYRGEETSQSVGAEQDEEEIPESPAGIRSDEEVASIETVQEEQLEAADTADQTKIIEPTNTSSATVTNAPQPTPTYTLTPLVTPRSESETAIGNITLDSGEEITGDVATVIRIIDGDTIEVDVNGQNYRVRYIGMDTPERGDLFFDEATEANRQLVEGQMVILVKDVSETDRFGRLLRYVYLQNGTFVNAELLKQGFALVATFPPDVAFQDLFTTLQQEARAEGRGLWAQPEPTNTAVSVPTSAPIPLPTNTSVPIASNTPVPVATNTPLPPPPATSTPEPPPSNCDPAYPDVCIPSPPPDLDCGDIPYRRFRVLPPDPHGFDRDNDGIGCESG